MQLSGGGLALLVVLARSGGIDSARLLVVYCIGISGFALAVFTTRTATIDINDIKTIFFSIIKFRPTLKRRLTFSQRSSLENPKSLQIVFRYTSPSTISAL